MGALDAEFREAMRAEIKRLHLAQKATTVYVTHDQVEAMAMGDRIVVMSAAVVQQIGTPAEVYHSPANLFVANFIGSPGMNLIKGNYANGVVNLPGGNKYAVPEAWKPVLAQRLTSDEVIIGFRPEAARVGGDAPLNSNVYAVDLHGAYNVLARQPERRGDIQHLRASRDVVHPINAPVRFDIDPQMVRFFDPKTEAAIPLPLGARRPAAGGGAGNEPGCP